MPERGKPYQSDELIEWLDKPRQQVILLKNNVHIHNRLVVTEGNSLQSVHDDSTGPPGGAQRTKVRKQNLEANRDKEIFSKS